MGQDGGAGGSADAAEAPVRSPPAGSAALRGRAKDAQRARQRPGVRAAPGQGRRPTWPTHPRRPHRDSARSGPVRDGTNIGRCVVPVRIAARRAGSVARDAEGPRARAGLPPRSEPCAAGPGGPGSNGCAEPRAGDEAGFEGSRRRLDRSPPAAAPRRTTENGSERPRSVLRSARRGETLVVTMRLLSRRAKRFSLWECSFFSPKKQGVYIPQLNV